MMGRKPPVPENGQTVAQAENLVEAMRNVQNDGTVRPQPVDQREQDLAFSRGERRCRLVESNDAGVEHHRLGNLYHLALADRQGCNLRPGIDVDTDLREPFTDDADKLPAIDDTGPAGKAAEPEVLGNRQLRHELQFLMNDDDAGVEGVAYRAIVLRPAVDANFTGVGCLVTGEHPDKGGFPRTVFAHQSVNGTLAHGKGDIRKRLNAGIAL